MKLDRTMQLDILTKLQNIYPSDLMINELNISAKETDDVQSILSYLSEHDLIEPVIKRPGTNVSPSSSILSAKITAKGIDFLEEDGGLSSVLNTVTVKFDAENIRTLFKDKIIASSLPGEEKKNMLERVKSLSGDVLKTVVLKLIEKGLEKPDLLSQMFNLIS